MPRTTLIVRDHCNVRFTGLDAAVRRRMCEALRFVVPKARYTPQYKLGRWDGTVSFCTVAGSTYLNLLDRVLPIIMEAGYDIEIDDQRPSYDFSFPEIDENVVADRCWPTGHQLSGQPIVLRDYQVNAIQTFTNNLQSIQALATGAGKTVVTATLSSLVQRYGRSIVIVPSKTLVTQTERDYRNLSLDVGVFYGDRKEYGHTHTIATWQSLASLKKRGQINAFLEGMVCVMVDEVHVAKASVLKDLLTGPFAHVPIRWGLTGTIPKEDHEQMCLLSSIGDVVGKVSSIELQDKGVLANCQVEVIQLQDTHVEFRDYDSEHDFLVTDAGRLRYIADLVRLLAENGNTLMLVDRIETGEILQKLMPEAVFIHGDVKNKVRQSEYDSVKLVDGKVIVATYGVAAVGIDMPRIFNLILLEPGTSFVRVIQSVGRGLRRALDKDHIRIVDLCSSLVFSKRHLSKRRQYYNEAQFPQVIKKVDYLNGVHQLSRS